ncbi:MAG: lipopolysaccharide transport periplasmic protein LptA [Thioalkalispiraceae bacterium]|jgi:lipopolysaccharide export system protein LptA
MFRVRIYITEIIVAFFALTASSPGFALRSDRDQPIDIQADRVEIKEKEEISEYIGNVHLKQGSLDIKADKVTVYLKNGRLIKILIMGNPAVFKQKPEDNKDVVRSSAMNMEYFASKQHLILKTNASVVQGDNHFSGDFIEYDTLNSTVKANKDKGSESRVHAIIKPGKTSSDQPATDQQEQTTPPQPNETMPK